MQLSFSKISQDIQDTGTATTKAQLEATDSDETSDSKVQFAQHRRWLWPQDTDWAFGL